MLFGHKVFRIFNCVSTYRAAYSDTALSIAPIWAGLTPNKPKSYRLQKQDTAR
ncbi:Hypothetical protein NGK_1719 [Neisseria gonorrhoeae NCCP11945]|uniref:Uncharacterized protein n=1 Tax=Neisseria gonorrhoeae (strain NCCP11945) TaxID=521006 RepID=B4RP59_NEIG2|nr:Hypothetical protein NGK_1719 [Neisseria gonorrhoeae NCCP11945]